MLEIQKTYIHKHQNIDTYFVTFNEEQMEHIVIKDNIIYIKGSESYINILLKTLEALEYINTHFKNKYDFVVRSNISTIINLDNLYKYLLSCPDTNLYTGGTVESLQWLLQPYEISEKKQENRNDYYGLKYIQGTGIIMSNDVVNKILKIKENIEYDIVDDVKLGITIRDNFPEIYKNIGYNSLAKVSFCKFEEDSVFIRNRSYERKMDIHGMRNIVNVNINTLINTQYSNFEKTIHITKKTIDEKLIKVKKEWEYLNPEYKVELYDDERCLNVLYKYYGKKYCDIFNFIKDGPIKADFFRVCLIYVFGGIYVDADIKPIVPLNHYIDDDVDLMTCISYNYDILKIVFCYNPQMIVAKKYSNELFKIVCEYEYLYDNREKFPYTYWGWSICNTFKKIENFDITSNGENIFIYKNKKYKFIIEEIIDKNDNETYNFENFKKHKDELLKKSNISVYCKYMDNIILNNFTNKY
jgi:mannosyltransferase OCH1-like enzyme